MVLIIKINLWLLIKMHIKRRLIQILIYNYQTKRMRKRMLNQELYLLGNAQGAAAAGADLMRQSKSNWEQAYDRFFET